MLLNEEEKFLSDFKNSFEKFKNKNIILYGTGIKTKLILENIGYAFWGIMDKDPENIEKTFLNHKILGYDEVINTKNPLIIIVSGDIYFQTIFSRIEFLQTNHDIPIYFCNGAKAQSEKKDQSISQKPYWQKTVTQLKSEIDKHEIISFDIFDTLVTRKLLEPLNLHEVSAQNIKTPNNFVRERTEIEYKLGNSANLDKIYKNLSKKYKIKSHIEEKLELKYSIPRYEMVEIFNYAIEKNKEIYLISDIYHEKEFIIKLLEKANIKNFKDILISCQLGKRKADMSLWKHYKDIIGNKKALHIGDNLRADITNAENIGISTFHVLSPYDLLQNSTWKDILPKVQSLQDALIMGNIISKIFNSPFALSKTKGTPFFNRQEDIGYIFYAPILFNYIVWILQQTIKNNTSTILFVARDGYFLEKLYQLVVKKLKIKNPPKAEYLMVSRVLSSYINLHDESDIQNILKIKFKGKLKDYLKIRFGLDIEISETIDTSLDIEKIIPIVEKHKEKIFKKAKEQRKLYLQYLKTKVQGENIAVIDPSYNGTNQFFLSKLLQMDLKGYYCNANLSNQNPYFSGDNMFALFQKDNDPEAKNSNLRKNAQFFEEGILVAPTGTCLQIKGDLDFVYTPKGNTQKNFKSKEKIFKGIKEFFKDMLKNYKNIDQIPLNADFIDFFIEIVYSKKSCICPNIKNEFYCDTLYETIYDRKLFE